MYQIFRTFLENRFLSRWVVLLLDLFIVFSSSVISYSVVQQAYKSLVVSHPNIWEFLAITGATALSVFFVFRTYQGIIRYSTLYEIQKIFIALVISQVLNFIFLHLILDYSGSITITYCAILLLTSSVALLGFRIFIVYAYQRILTTLGKDKVIPVFIFGTGPESVSLKQAMTIAQSKYKVVGFVTLDKGDVSKRIANLPIILFNKDSLNELKRNSVRAIIFSDENYDKELIEKLIAHKIKIFVAPQPKDINDMNEPLHKKIRPIQIEDLLGRKEINISMDIIAQNIEGRNVLVTGAAGSIGSEIVRQVAQFKPKSIICLDQAETPLHDLDLELKSKYPKLLFVTVIGDVRNDERMTMVFNRYKPNVVYHAAAYKHVPMMEKNPCEAILTNVFGTMTVVERALSAGVEMFVMVSTDKAVNPTNIMGASKRLAEIYVQCCALIQQSKGANVKLVTTRFGNVLGSNGSVIPLFRKQIEAGGPITVTDPEITRYFMTIPEACRLVLEASAIGNTGHIYVFDMGEPVKIVDLAKKMIELAGLVPNKDIEIVFSGLRPGEKLYEELLNDDEKTIPTKHEKVMIAKVREHDYDEIKPQIEELIRLSREVKISETVQLMKVLVPEFVSNNSEFGKYDK